MRFTVLGEPQPAGSKRGFVVTPKGGGKPRAVVADDNRKAKPWQAEVKAAAHDALGDGFELIRGPVELTLTFIRPRPKGHFRTGRNAGCIKASAPPFPITRPDALKLARAVEDALTGVVWADDSMIVDETLHKRYGEPARCEIEIRELHTHERSSNAQ
jgi:Holliday junction resolvase RusA-like endonuclease